MRNRARAESARGPYSMIIVMNGIRAGRAKVEIIRTRKYLFRGRHSNLNNIDMYSSYNIVNTNYKYKPSWFSIK